MDGWTPPNAASEPQSQVCVANIDTVGRRQRLIAGVVQFGISLAILGVMLGMGVERGWRLALVLPFAGAAAGFFQWRDRT